MSRPWRRPRRIAHSPSGTMKPISSASGMKVPGETMPFSGWRQRIEGLEAADVVAREIDDRLVVQLELAGRQRLAQVALQRAPHLHLRVHLRLEEAVGAAPVALGAIEREVGVAHAAGRGSCRRTGPTAMPTLVPITT